MPRHFSLKYVSIPTKKCLAQRKNPSLPVTSRVFRYTLDNSILRQPRSCAFFCGTIRRGAQVVRAEYRMEIRQPDPASYAGKKFTARYQTRGYYDISASESGFDTDIQLKTFIHGMEVFNMKIIMRRDFVIFPKSRNWLRQRRNLFDERF